MKLNEIVKPVDQQLTEEYSDEFAEKILNESANGNWREVTEDELFAQIDRLSAEAKKNGQTTH